MPIQELIYTSVAETILTESDVSEILDWSERYNASVGITGLLLFDGKQYIQILEGKPETVDALFLKIKADTRHSNVEFLYKGSIEGRAFKNWRMAYEALPQGLLEDLAINIGAYALEVHGETLAADDSFGARLNTMFINAMAAE